MARERSSKRDNKELEYKELFLVHLKKNPKLLYKYYTNLIKMLQDRGYDIKLNSYKEFTKNPLIENLELVIKDGVKPIYISLINMFGEKKLGIYDFDLILDRAETELDKDYDVMIIVSEGISHDTRKKMKSIKDYINVQFFTTDELLISRNHFFQPKVKILTSEELKQVCKSYYLTDTMNINNEIKNVITPEKLPVLKEDDYLTRHYGLKIPTDENLGTGIFIERQDGSVYYRYPSKRIGS